MPTVVTLQIPKPGLKGLSQLLQLPDEQYKQMEEALREAGPFLNARRLSSEVAQKTGIDNGTVLSILRVILSLYSTRVSGGVSMSDFLEHVRATMETEDSDTLEPPEGDWQRFYRKLEGLLSLEDSVGITSKALDVMTQHEHVYLSCRVLTDIRPIFSVNLSPSAAVIVHQLKLVYKQGSDEKEYFVALDDVDLVELQKALDRASKKGAKLRDEVPNFQYLDMEQRERP